MVDAKREAPKFTLIVALDELRAELRTTPLGAKSKLTLAELGIALEERGIVHGVKQAALEAVTRSPAAYQTNSVVVAEGTPPIAGADGRVEYVVEPSRHQAGFERPDGTIDFHAIGQFVEIAENTLVARVLPPTEGVAGTTVFGTPAPPPPPKPARPKLGPHITQRGDEIYATASGHLTTDPTGKLMVSRVLEIRGDVDFRTGNIDHIGDVSVRGAIRAGFVVKAKGNITVVGAVEAAHVEAEQNIEIRGVVIPGATIVAGGDIKARALEGCKAQAGRNIEVDQDILHSEVSAGKQVVCTRGKGVILGGLAMAGLRVVANQLGNDVNMPTAVEVGVSVALAKELHELEVSRKHLEAELRPLEANAAYMEKQWNAGTLPPQRAVQLKKLLAQKAEVVQRLETLAERHAAILAEKEKFGGQIDIARRVHGNVTISIGAAKLKNDKTLGRCRMKLVDGEIKIST